MIRFFINHGLARFELSNWFQNDLSTTFSYTVHGKSLLEYYMEEPRVGDSFNNAMASDSRLIVDVLINKCKHVFEDLTSLMEVGGGTCTSNRHS